MRNLVILFCLIIGLGAVLPTPTLAAGEHLVVKTSSKDFSFSERKSIVVETLACNENGCNPVAVSITQLFDVLKIQNISLGKYRFSKMTNLPLTGIVQSMVTFSVSIAGYQQEVDKKVTVKPGKAYRKWSAHKKWRYRRYLRHQRWLARVRARKLNVFTQTQNVDTAKPSTQQLAKVEFQPKAVAPVRELPGQMQQQSKPVAKTVTKAANKETSNVSAIKVDQSEEYFFSTYWFWIVSLSVMIFGLFLNHIKTVVRRASMLLTAHCISVLIAFCAFTLPFAMQLVSLSAPVIALYTLSALISLAVSVVIIFKGCLSLAIIRKQVRNNEVEEKFVKPEWEKVLYGQIPIFLWFDDLKDHPFHGFGAHPVRFFRFRVPKMLRYVTIVSASVIIILISITIIPGQQPAIILPIIYDAHQEGTSWNGLVSTYQIKYSTKLFNAQNSFVVRKDLVRRPKWSDFYSQNREWQLGEDIINIARKYNANIFTLDDQTVEIWTFQNLSAEQFASLVEETNSAIARGLQISQLEPLRKPQFKKVEIASSKIYPR